VAQLRVIEPAHIARCVGCLGRDARFQQGDGPGTFATQTLQLAGVFVDAGLAWGKSLNKREASPFLPTQSVARRMGWGH